MWNAQNMKRVTCTWFIFGLIKRISNQEWDYQHQISTPLHQVYKFRKGVISKGFPFSCWIWNGREKLRIEISTTNYMAPNTQNPIKIRSKLRSGINLSNADCNEKPGAFDRAHFKFCSQISLIEDKLRQFWRIERATKIAEVQDTKNVNVTRINHFPPWDFSA